MAPHGVDIIASKLSRRRRDERTMNLFSLWLEVCKAAFEVGGCHLHSANSGFPGEEMRRMTTKTMDSMARTFPEGYVQN